MKHPLLCLLFLLAGAPVLAQHGGKAEPKRIEFARGHASTTVTETLSNDQEMDLVFAARSGQTVTLAVSSVPAGRLFDFHIQGDGFDLPTEFDHYTSYTFKAAESGDYLVFIRKRPVKTPKKAKFILRLSIK